MRRINLSDTIIHPEENQTVRKKNSPVIVYDTSGPYSDPDCTIILEEGLPRMREDWYVRRKDIVRLPAGTTYASLKHPPYRAKEDKTITQLFYAKKRVITPEMEFVAIRENQQVEALGLKSYITPEFVRKEIASGRAVIPANINHPELEPMILGKRFLVKINTNTATSGLPIRDELEKAIWGYKWGTDALMDLSADTDSYAYRDYLIRTCPVPLGTVPVYEALTNAGGEAQHLTWDIFRETLIAQAEQGVDFVTIHAGMRLEDLKLTESRLTGFISQGGFILKQWMQTHQQENFLYTHFDEICEILRAYDITLSLGSGFRSGSIYDANDSAQFTELRRMRELTETAWKHFVQVIVEGPGHVPMNKIQENMKEHQYCCKGVPLFTPGMITTDIAPGYDHITAAIGGAQVAWHGASLIGGATPKEYLDHPDTEDICAGVVAHKIAAHAADLGKGHPGAQIRDNALSKARCEARWQDQQALALNPDRVCQFYNERGVSKRQWKK